MKSRIVYSVALSALLFAAPAYAQTEPAPAPTTDPAAPPPTLPTDPAAPGAAAPAAAPTAADVDKTLTDLFGSAEPYKTALTDLQKATAEEDKKAVAAMVSYPLTVKIEGAEKTYEDEKALIAGYDEVFTPATLLAIKNQTYETLFATSQGVMIGPSGEVWISEVMTDEPEPKSEGVKIIAVNH